MILCCNAVMLQCCDNAVMLQMAAFIKWLEEAEEESDEGEESDD